MIVEWAYSLIDTCERYHDSYECDLYLKIIHNQVTEEVFADLMTLLAKLKKHFIKIAEKEDGTLNKAIPRKQVNSMPNKFFPAKSDDFMIILRYVSSYSFSF